MNNRNLFDNLDSWINSVEGSVVNLLTAMSPWLAPLAPAYMTFRHMDEFLHFPIYISFPLALLVEILGFGTVSTGLDFWFFNRRERANAKKAPIEVVVGVFVFYLALILVSNVVIDVAVAYLDENWQKAAVIVVRALLTLQTIPGALIVAVRTGHRELLSTIKREKAEKDDGTSRTTSGSIFKTSITSKNTSESNSKMGRPSVHQERVYSYLEEELSKSGRVPTYTDVVRDLTLPPATASRLRKEWIDYKNGG